MLTSDKLFHLVPFLSLPIMRSLCRLGLPLFPPFNVFEKRGTDHLPLPYLPPNFLGSLVREGGGRVPFSGRWIFVFFPFWVEVDGRLPPRFCREYRGTLRNRLSEMLAAGPGFLSPSPFFPFPLPPRIYRRRSFPRCVPPFFSPPWRLPNVSLCERFSFLFSSPFFRHRST